jgi:hypothetical protein
VLQNDWISSCLELVDLYVDLQEKSGRFSGIRRSNHRTAIPKAQVRMDGYSLLQDGSNAQTVEFWSFTSAIEKMPPIRVVVRIVASVFAFAQSSLGLLSPVHRLAGNGSASAVCNNPQLSCHNTTTVDNLCCFNSPGGSLLQTQFWDTDPASGPSDSWTIHGLWVCATQHQLVVCETYVSISQITAMEPTSNSAMTLAHTQTSQPSWKPPTHRCCNT